MHSSCAAASVRAPCAFLESVALLDTSNTAVPAPPRPSRSCIRTRLAPVDASLPSGVEKATTGALVIHKADDRLALRCVRLLRQLFTRSNAGIARDISAVVSVYACAAGNHFIAITLFEGISLQLLCCHDTYPDAPRRRSPSPPSGQSGSSRDLVPPHIFGVRGGDDEMFFRTSMWRLESCGRVCFPVRVALLQRHGGGWSGGRLPGRSSRRC